MNIINIKQKLEQFRRCERAASAIEFAMISAFLSILLLNIVDISMFMFKKMEITGAVRAGAQYALVDQTTVTSALIQGVVEDSTSLSTLVVSVDDTQCGCSDGRALFTCGADSCSSGTTGRTLYYTQIDATYVHTWIFYPGTIDITAASTIRTQ